MSRERAVNFVWLALALAAVLGGLQLGIGTLAHPGPGTFPFGLGFLLAVLAVISFVTHGRKPPETKAVIAKVPSEPPPPLDGRRVLVQTALMIGYALVVEPAGFILATALFLTVTMRPSRSTWKRTLAWSIGTTLALALVFRLTAVRIPLAPPGMF